MGILLSHPEVAFRSCADCHKWVYRDKPGEMGSVVLDRKTGKPLERPKQSKPPCSYCPKGPTPFEKELTARNWQAFQFYLECKAVGRFPEDSIVRRYASLIRWIEDQIARKQMAAEGLQTMLASLIGGSVRGC